MKLLSLVATLVAAIVTVHSRSSRLERSPDFIQPNPESHFTFRPFPFEDSKTTVTAEPKDSLELEETFQRKGFVSPKANKKKNCNDVFGKCISKIGANKCDGDVNKKAKCDNNKEVCCVSTTYTIQFSTKQKCEKNGGQCMPKKECTGTVDQDYNCSKKEACCFSTTTVTSKPSKACEDNGGECLSKKDCKGTLNKNYKCNKKFCCVTETVTSKPSKKCEDNGGECMSKKDCNETVNIDFKCGKKEICCVSETGESFAPATNCPNKTVATDEPKLGY